jgi:hypothetical protein
VELETGVVVLRHDLTQEHFGEGLTILGNEIYQLTWQSGIAFIYDLETFEVVGGFEGGRQVVVSNLLLVVGERVVDLIVKGVAHDQIDRDVYADDGDEHGDTDNDRRVAATLRRGEPHAERGGYDAPVLPACVMQESPDFRRALAGLSAMERRSD